MLILQLYSVGALHVASALLMKAEKVAKACKDQTLCYGAFVGLYLNKKAKFDFFTFWLSYLKWSV